MKKGLIFLLGIISFLGMNTVSAKELYLEYDTNVNDIKPYIEELGYDSINDAINKTIMYYNENLYNDYPYFFISLSLLTEHNVTKFYTVLTAFDDTNFDYAYFFDQTFDTSYLLNHGAYSNYKQFYYDYVNNNIVELGVNDGFAWLSLFDIDNTYKLYNVYNYYYSNFDLYYRGDLLSNSLSEHLTYLKYDDILYIPSLSDSTKYSIHQANSKFLVEPFYLYDDNNSFFTDVYTTINLNEYSYVALSLKDYNTIPESNNSNYTNIYVNGQLCITPVYNYGLTERKDILSGTQMQGCSKYYDDFTLTRMYILKSDVQNHSIYYLKAYDTSKDNYVKIDSSKFNITYITEENKDNPEVLINGKLYPTLPYGSLTDTSTKSEDEGYNSGVSCAVGDFNCYNENNPGNLFDSIFSSPLEFLKDIWSSVTSIFDIITEFLSLLPDTMQSFLYLSFMIAIILGLLKLIL